MTPTVSVVVPTTRPDRIRRLVDHLAAHPPAQGWELIVVDNRVDDHEPLDLGPSGGDVRVVREPVPGAAQARNRGVEKAAGTIVVFYDDDLVPAPGCTSALVEPIVEGQADVTGGRVRLAAELPGWLTPPLPGYLSAHDRGDEPQPVPVDDHVLSACMAVRREVLDAVGGFDPSLGPRPGHHLTNDDVALCEDLHAAGARIRYVPAAEVLHDVPPERLTRRYVLSRAWWQGTSDHRLDLHRGRGTPRRDLIRNAARDVKANIGRKEPGTWIRVATTLARATAHLTAPLSGN